MAKANWMHVAEVVDAWRVVPRSFLFAWSTFTMDIGYRTLSWFFAQPANSRGFEEASVVVGVFTAALGMTKLIFDRYSLGGRDWAATPATDVQQASPQ
jgi:hypothetical protein